MPCGESSSISCSKLDLRQARGILKNGSIEEIRNVLSQALQEIEKLRMDVDMYKGSLEYVSAIMKEQKLPRTKICAECNRDVWPGKFFD